MTDLDDPDGLTALDSLGGLHYAEGLSEQVEKGFGIGSNARDLPDPGGSESIAVFGMGGSGFAGDAARVVLEPRLPLFMRTIKTYPPLPEWVGRNTLAIVVSYSGNTEETTACLAEARERGARIITVSAGGALREAAESFGTAHVSLPPGLLPRYAVGYLVMSVVGVLAALRLTPDMRPLVDEATRMLTHLEARCSRHVPVRDNPAKALAEAMVGRAPVVYGSAGLAAVAAYRFKCDINENAKIPAATGEIPEMNHNELEAWGHWSVNARVPYLAVHLRDPHEDPRITARYEAMKETLTGRVEAVTVEGSGEGRLARLLSLVGMTQLASIYLALKAGRDPGPIEVLENFKERLAAKT